MVCVLTQDQLDKLFQKVVKDLLTMSEKGQPFVMKDYILSLYNRVSEVSGDKALAETYAALVPSKIGLARAVNKTIKKLVPDVQEVEQLESEFENIDNVSKYLNLTPSEGTLVPSNQPSPEQAEVNKPVTRGAHTISLRPNTLLATTGNEGKESLEFSYGFIRSLSDLDDTQIFSDESGYYISLANGGTVLRLGVDTNNDRHLNSIVSVVTDENGNVIYFDDNYKVTTKDKGKAVFFEFRDSAEQVQTAREIQMTKGFLTLQDAERALKQEMNLIRFIKGYLNANPNSKLVNKISGISNGFLDVKFDNQVNLKDYANQFNNYTVSILVSADEKGQNKTHILLQSPDSKSNPILIVGQKVSDLGQFLEDSIKIIMGGPEVTDSSGKVNKNSIALRQEFLRVYYGNNSRVRINGKGEPCLVTKDTDGKTLWSVIKSEDELRKALTTYTARDGKEYNSAINAYQNYAGGVVGFESKNGKYVLTSGGRSGTEYVNFIINNSFTFTQPNGEGNFTPFHPYFVFEPTNSTKEEIREYIKEKTSNKPATTPTAAETTGTEEKEEAPKEKTPKTFKKKTFKKTEAKSDEEIINNIKNKLNKLDTQRDLSEVVTDQQIQEALDWYKSHPISKFVPFETMFDAVNTSNPKAVATWTEAGITLFKGSNFTDLYHEAFHAFSQMFISAKERQKIYDSVREQKGSFTDYKGKKILFKDANDLQVEEYLAEEFRKFMLSKGTKTVNNYKTKSFFQKLLDILKALFNFNIEDTVTNYEASSSLNELFTKLRAGNINSVPYGYENRQFDKLDRITAVSPDLQEELDSLPYSKQFELVDSIDSIFSAIADEYDSNETSGLKFTSSLVSTPEDRANAYRRVYNEFIDAIEKIESQLESKDESDPDYQDLLNNYNVLAAAIGNFSVSGGAVTAQDVIDAQTNGIGLIAYHMKESKFLTFEDKFDSLFDAEEESKKGKGEFNKNSGNEISAKKLATKDVHYLIRGLFQHDAEGNIEKNSFGFNKLMDFDTSWNRISKLLEGLRDTDQIYNKIKGAAQKSKFFEQLLNKLGTPDSSNSLSQINLWTNFTNAFTLKRIPLTQVTVALKDSGVSVTTGIASSETDFIKRSWDNRFSDPSTGNKYIQPVKPGSTAVNQSRGNSAFLKVDKVINDFASTYQTDPIRFLHALGMDVSDHPAIKKALTEKKGVLGDFVKLLYNRLRAISGSDIYINRPSQLVELSINDETLTGLYKKLLQLENQYSDKYTTDMVTNAKRDVQYELSLRSTVSNMIDKLNSVNKYTDLFETDENGELKYPEMAWLNVDTNPAMKHSVILKIIFGENFWQLDKGFRQNDTTIATGRKERGIQLLNSSGVALTENDEHLMGVSSNDADEITSILQNFFSFVQYGVSEGTRHSDKSSTFLYKIVHGNKHYIPLSRFVYGDDGLNQAVYIMSGYLSGEVARIFRLKNNDPSANILVGDTTYGKIADKLIAFEDILKPTTRKEVLKHLSENFEEELNKNTKLREMVQKDIKTYLEKQVEAFKEDFASTGASKNKKLMDELRKSLDTTKADIKLDDSEKDNALFTGYVVNDWIHKFETTNLFYGDIALYNYFKEEFHKRNAGVAATGTIPRSDASMLALLNGYYKGKYAESALFESARQQGYELTDYARNRKRGRTMNAAVLEDTAIKSTYYDLYVEKALEAEKTRLGKKTLTDAEKEAITSRFKEYKKMKIGDAQGWITFDAYRELLMRLGKWSTYQEKMYVKILNNEDISDIDVSQFFPVKKMQYWGPLANTKGLPAFAFHKFSLMPLIPSVIKNTPLEDLHNRMVSQGIDYATFNSGSKVSTITKDGKPDKFYNNPADPREGTAFSNSDYVFTRNEIFLDYFKDQLEIQDTYKGSIIFSTQLRKLVEEGLYENGRPKSFKGTREEWDNLTDAQKKTHPKAYNEYQKIIKYEFLVNQLTEHKLKELLKETDLTYNPETGKYNLSEKLITYVKKELSRQDLAEHEIDFIKYDNIKGDLVFDLSIHPSAESIDKLLSALIYKKLIRQKVTGEALIQVSGAGLESKSGLRNATDEEIKKYGTNGLRFYEYSESGILPMQVKIALQGDFKKLLKHKEVLIMAKANPGMSKLEALNKLLKDEKFLADNKEFRDMITISGVRIPVQGLNSMEFMQVAEFLPENAGNMVILPAEIVAKSGSDFDIDKLTLMFPSILKTSKGVSLVKYNPKLDINTDSHKDRIKELYKNLNEANENVNEYIKDYLASVPEELKEDLYDTARYYRQEIKRLNSEIMNEFEMGNMYPKNLYDQIYDLQQELDDIFKEASKPLKEYRSNIIDPIMDEIDNLKTELASSSSEGIENDLLLSLVDIISMPDNFLDLVTPNDTFLIKHLAEELSDYVRDYNPMESLNNDSQVYEENGKKRISGTRIFELRYNRYKQLSNSIGKRTLGMGAVDNTYNTIFNRVGAYMSASIMAGGGENKYRIDQVIRGMAHNKIAIKKDGKTVDVISLSNLYDANNKNRISTVISQMMNGWVDVAKDSWIFDIQGNPEVSSVLLFMIQAGIDIDQAVYFVSQPVVRDYVKEQRRIKSAFAKTLNVPSAGTNMFRVEARRQILTKLVPEDRYIEDKKGKRIDRFSNFNLTKTLFQADASDSLINRYLKNPDYSLSTLRSNIKKKTKGYTKTDLEVFLHFLELEEMSKATTAVKLTLNVDTSKQSTLFELKSKKDAIDELTYGGRMPGHIVADILSNSPIGSFNKNREGIDLISALMPTRNDNQLYRILSYELGSMFPDDFNLLYGKSFKTKDDFGKAFINDYTNFILQTYLNEPSRFSKQQYKGLETVINIEKTKLFREGAFVDNGKLYVDFKQLDKEFETDKLGTPAYSKSAYFRLKGKAPVQQTYFINSDYNVEKTKYYKFVFEREFLRSQIPFEAYAETADFGYRLDDVISRREKKVTPELINEEKRLAYEEFLRDHALFNTLNINFMFMDTKGYANQLMSLVKQHPELLKYSVLNSLHATKKGQVTNIKLSELTLEPRQKTIYHEELTNLADPTVLKVDNELDNQIISKLFSMLAFFNFIQSGQSSKAGGYNLSPIVDSRALSLMLNEATTWHKEFLNTEEGIYFEETYMDLFKNLYRNPTADQSNPDDENDEPKVREIIKRYQNRTKVEKPVGKFISQSEDNPLIFTFDMSHSSVTTPEAFEKKMKYLLSEPSAQPTVSEDKDVVFVYDDSILSYSQKNNMGRVGDKFSTTYLKDLVAKKVISKANTLGIMTKSISSPVMSEDFITDDTYAENVERIEAGIQELIKKRDAGTKIVFNKDGYGNDLIKLSPDNKYYAPETFVYLSKRLFEEFGFINPSYLKVAKMGVESAKELAKEMVKNEPVTDEQVMEKQKECFKSLLLL